ncbi:MAG: hypothetical protein KDK39_04345 [Leptospiraceae bacterium]|nr:hypothetical protein [Leptospiraceae bacterium]
MNDGYLIVFGLGLGLLAFLIWMLFSIRNYQPPAKEKPRGICPLCQHELMKGERIRSDQTEIGDIELQTWIKGCPYCMPESSRLKRRCPVCKKEVPKDGVILALSNPKIDARRLSIKGCQQCWPQGFSSR